MAPCLYALLALALPKATISQTVVSEGSPFTDDFLYADDDDFTKQWYFPQASFPPSCGRIDLGSALTSCSSSWCGSEGQIWGWWQYCDEDPARSMARIFECDSRAVATVEATFYGCIESTSNTVFYLRATRGAGGLPDFDEIPITDFDVTYSTGSWTNLGSSTPNVGSCNNNIRSFTKSLTFDLAAGQTVSIAINTDLNGGNVNGNWAAFNGFSFTCNNVPTPEPTPAPTSPTKSPTKEPSETPTRAPTDSPTPAPTDQPSQSPITPGQPTSEPSMSPTKDPTADPTVDPTVSPTKDPSFAPIPAPTPSPVRGPTKSPTEDVGLFEAAFGGGNGCADGWIQCNIEVFVILIILGVGFVFYWILGSVWYKRRQNNRPVPAHMSPHVEMGGGTTGAATHATSSKWKSAYELEQEQKAAQAQAGGQQPGYGY